MVTFNDLPHFFAASIYLQSVGFDINMLGNYTFTLAEQVTKGQLRPLKQEEETAEWPL